MPTVLRTRRNHNKYKAYAKQVDRSICQFCAFSISDSQVVSELPHFWVVNNLFGYDMWDTTGVVDHLMLVPKRHIVALSDYNSAEQKEFFEVIKTYEAQNYSVYARAPANINKSITHQHTHLIKIDGKAKRFIFFLKKPHLLLMK